jgi:SPP1 family predicted phage head-tail adaptor
MRGMNPGRLRHRVELQRPVLTQDAITGEMIEAWETVSASVPAEVLTGPGREYREAGATQAEVALRLTMRPVPGISQTWRVIWSGFIFDIRSIEFDETAARTLRIECRNPKQVEQQGDDGFLLENGVDLFITEGGDILIPE